MSDPLDNATEPAESPTIAELRMESEVDSRINESLEQALKSKPETLSFDDEFPSEEPEDNGDAADATEPKGEPSEQPAETTAPHTADTDAVPQVDPYLLSRAQSYGVDIDGMSNAQIGKILMVLDQRNFPPKQTQPETQAAQPVTPEFNIPNIGFTEEQLESFDDDQKQMLNQFVEQVKQGFTALSQQNQQAIQHQQEIEQNYQRQEGLRRIDRFDEICNSSSDLEKLVGKGRCVEMQQGSPELQARDAIFNHMRVIQVGREATGQQPLSDKAAFDQAVRALYPDVLVKKTKQDLKNKLTARERQMSVKPGRRAKETVEMTPQEEYFQRANEILAAKGKQIHWR